MKKISLVFALAFAFTTGMAVVTAVAHTDRAMADSAGQLSCVQSKRLNVTARIADIAVRTMLMLLAFGFALFAVRAAMFLGQ
jgi:hypothetical protein